MSTEVTELEDSARKVLAALGVPANEDKTWTQVKDLGWLLVAVPEDLGGLGLGQPGANAIYRELGRGLSAAPYLPAMLALEAVSASSLADRESWVRRIAGGDYVAAPLTHAALSIKKSGGKEKLSGTASAVPSADKAGHILAAAADGSRVALVPLKQAGVTVTPRDTWDRTRRLFDVTFADVALDEASILARGNAAQELMRALARHRDFALAADSVGAANALLDMTIEYLKTRRQYGRPLAMFQALKHRCADLKVHIAAAEALLLDSLGRLGHADSEHDPDTMAKAAKSLACSVFLEVAEEAIQLHGGIAMTSEHPCHLYVKRAMLNAHLGGSNESHDLDVANSFLTGA